MCIRDRRLLDAKRANNLAIILSRLQLTVPQMRAAILSCDESALPAEKLTSLLKCVPTAAEIELVATAVDGAAADGLDDGASQPLALGLAEQFVRDVGSIPRLRQRLECLAFKSRFASELRSLYADAMAVSVACDDVRESTTLRRLLGVVLGAGNALNGGSFRGGAHGVRLECVTRLAELKSTQPTGARPDLLCFCLHATAPQPIVVDGAERDACTDALDFVRVRVVADALSAELASARAAARMCTAALAEDVRLFEAGYAAVEDELRAGAAGVAGGVAGGGARTAGDGATAPDDGQLQRALGAFCAQAGAQVRGLRAELVRVEAEFSETRAFYGEEEGVTVSDFFGRLSAFVAQLEAVSARCAAVASAQRAKRQRTG